MVARDADSRLNVFVVPMADRTLWYRWQTTSSNSNQWFDGWISLEGHWSPRRIPAIAQNADGRLEVFMVGSDGRFSKNGRLQQIVIHGLYIL